MTRKQGPETTWSCSCGWEVKLRQPLGGTITPSEVGLHYSPGHILTFYVGPEQSPHIGKPIDSTVGDEFFGPAPVDGVRGEIEQILGFLRQGIVEAPNYEARVSWCVDAANRIDAIVLRERREAQIEELEGLCIGKPMIGPNGEDMKVNEPDHQKIWERITSRLKELRSEGSPE